MLLSIPSKKWEEQFGYVLVEAMSCDKPVISTYSGAIPEVVKDVGTLVQPKDIKSLNSSLVSILNDPKKEGTKGRELVLKNYDQNIIAKRLAKLFNQIL